jgi:hypothetical protein
MGVVYDPVNAERRIEGDDFGAGAWRIQLAAAPAAAKRMQICMKAHVSPVGTGDWDLKGWNHTNFFGLRFSSAIPKFPIPIAYPGSHTWWPTDFFGIMQMYPLNTSSLVPWISDPATKDYDRIGAMQVVPTTWNEVTTGGPYLSGTAGWWTSSPQLYQPHSFLDGIGGRILTYASFSFAGAGHLTQTDSYHMLHAHATSAAVWTKAWEIWASNVDRTMYYSLVQNQQSLSGDGMFAAFTNGSGSTIAQVKTGTIHGDVASNWRTDLNTVNFPRWLMFRHSLPQGNFIFKEARVRYFDWAGNELEA